METEDCSRRQRSSSSGTRFSRADQHRHRHAIITYRRQIRMELELEITKLSSAVE